MSEAAKRTPLTQPPDRDARLLAAHDQVWVVLGRHGWEKNRWATRGSSVPTPSSRPPSAARWMWQGRLQVS